MYSSWKGSRRGRGDFSHRSWSRHSQPPRVQQPPPPQLGTIVAKIYRDELDTSIDGNADIDPAKITNVQQVASYSWVRTKAPAILIPGKPPTWTPLLTPTKLKEDSGPYFRDRNAARFPKHPMQPSVEAIMRHQPDDSNNTRRERLDIIACSSTMGNLLRFVRGQEKAFRMIVEVIGSTVFLVRRENSPTEHIPGVYGYGHTFPEAYTSWGPDVKQSESHSRIIRYRFGGLGCVVRFEADGYLPDLVDHASIHQPEANQVSSRNGLQDVLLALQEATIATALTTDRYESKSTSKSRSSLEIRQDNDAVLIPQSAIFDLKTRSIRKRDVDTLGEEMARLWVSQIPNFILAYHKSGVFEEIQVLDGRKDMAHWEQRNERQLRLFAALLRKLVSFAQNHVSGRLEICREDGSNNIEIREQCDDVGKTLPREVEERWLSWLTSMSEESSKEGEFDGVLEKAGLEWDEQSEDDFTACSAASCGYCGRCRY